MRSKNKTKLYLGLDLSMSSAGVAVIEVADRIPRLVAAFAIKTDGRKKHGERLYTIYSRLDELVKEYGAFERIIRERGFSRFALSTQAIYKVVGVSDMLLRDYEIFEVSPTLVKKSVVGDGKASKQRVEKRVKELLRLDDDFTFATDDASDACGVILTYLISRGDIDE